MIYVNQWFKKVSKKKYINKKSFEKKYTKQTKVKKEKE